MVGSARQRRAFGALSVVSDGLALRRARRG
jgi:hypothetical protein